MKFILLFLLMLPLVTAQPSDISILEVRYERGEVDVINRFDSFGYVPGWMENEGEFELRVLQGDILLYNYFFDPPTREFLDGVQGGGMVERSSFNFPLVIPNDLREDRLEIIYPSGSVYVLEEETNKKWIWLFSILIGVILLSLLLILRKNLFQANP